MIIWSSVSFSYHMNNIYVKYLPGDIYVNMIVSGIADTTASLISSYIGYKIGLKNGLIIGFVLSFISGFFLIFITQSSDPFTMAVLIIVSRFGISFSFNLCVLGTSEYFPLLFRATAYGICNVWARTITITSPIIAEVKEPYPMLIFAFASLLSIATCFILKKV